MRILYVGRLDLGLEKGDTLHFLQLANALHQRGNELTVVAVGNKILPDFQHLDYRLVPDAKVGKVSLIAKDLLILTRAYRLLRKREYDLVYQRGVPYLNSMASRLATPAIVEVNGIVVNEAELKGASEARLRFLRYREQQIVSHARLVICVSEGIQGQLTSIYGVDGDTCVVIPNAADTRMFHPMSTHKCRQDLRIFNDGYEIGFVGSYNRWVDFRTFLEAIREIVDRGLRAKATLVGDGVLFDQVRNLIESMDLQEYVRMVGKIPHSEVPCWIGAFDVCVVPILPIRGKASGGSPLKLFEYMASARPVIATDVSGISEHILSANCGLLYPAQDSHALALQLERMLQNKMLRDELATNGLQYALENRSWDKVAQHIEELALQQIAYFGSMNGNDFR